MNKLLTYLTDEKQAKRKGGLYHKTQVNLAYNSNRIEGSLLLTSGTNSFIIAACASFPMFAVICSTLAFRHRILTENGLNIFITNKTQNTVKQ